MKLSLPVAVTTRVARQVLVAKKHSPTILFGAGVVGVVATTVTACRATLKVEAIIVEHQKMSVDIKTVQHASYSDKDRRQDLTLLYLKTTTKLTRLYGPSFVLGVTSIAALTGAHNIQRNRIAGLAAAYATVDKAFSEYRDRVTEQYGAEKEREIRYGVELCDVDSDELKKDGTPKKIKKKVGGKASMYAKFFERGNVNWSPTPEYNIMFIRSQQNYANDRLRVNGSIMLSDVYDLLGFDRTPASTQVGWLKDGDGDGFVDFGVFDDKSLQRFHEYVTGIEGELLLDFNVDGVVWDKI